MRAASNMLVAFQIVVTSEPGRRDVLDLEDLADRLRDRKVARGQEDHEANSSGRS